MNDTLKINLDYIFQYKGWTLVSFSELYGISSGAAGKYKRQELNFPVDLAIRLADDLNISLDYIYRWEITKEVLEAGDPYYVSAHKFKTAEPATIYEPAEPVNEVQNIKTYLDAFQNHPEMSERLNEQLLRLGENFLKQLELKNNELEKNNKLLSRKAV